MRHNTQTIGLLTLLAALAQATAAPSRPDSTISYASEAERFANAAVIPASGAHELRIISADTLELYIVSERTDDGSRPSFCDWVDDSSGQPTADMPAVSDLTASAGGGSVSISSIGFKRSVLYAPRGGRSFAMANSLLVKLASPLASGAVVTVENPASDAWPSDFSFTATFDSDRWGPAIHANQVGYEAAASKRAHVGFWLGDLGELDLSAGTAFQIIDAGTSATAFSGTLMARDDVGYTYTPAPYTEVFEADFSGLTTPGVYRLRVDGLGASMPFEIGAGIDGAFARNDASGLYHQRSGAAHSLPFTRHEDPPGHTAPATIPSNTDRTAFTFMWDFIQSESGGSITGPTDMLYPYDNSGTVDVTGGHHDAGDYSKYTTNSAMALHALTFAIDHFGVSALDNLGLPESGDGVGDLLQEAKIEADFLLKMQDTDGGFYLMVRPRERSFEEDVLPSAGDEQIVYPKNTTATAAALAALAELGSSPTFAAAYPTEAAAYLSAATAGWGFIDTAITTNGLTGSYQKIANVGESWGHDDELAWAAAAMFAATDDSAYQTQLLAWLPIGKLTQNTGDPLFPEIRDFGFKRMAEAWGCALRSYSFGHLSGRLPLASYDATYLAATDAEVTAAAQDIADWTADTAYGAALATIFKADGAAAYFFPISEAFDAMVGIELGGANSSFSDAIRENLNYAAGNNPADMSYLTGLGWRRQREAVSQFALNDSAILPPNGLPMGAINTGPAFLPEFLNSVGGNLLSNMLYPNTGISVFPYYDRWADSAQVLQEMTIPVLARQAAVTSALFANSPLASQSWISETATITGVPATLQIGNNYTASLSTALPLADARTTWEATVLEPVHSTDYVFSPERPGNNVMAADILMPDGRRAYATTSFNAVLDVPNPIETYCSDPLNNFDVVAWYQLDGDWTDAKALQSDLTPFGGNEAFDSTSFTWSNRSGGQALRLEGQGDGANVTIPHFFLNGSVATTISVEAMIMFDAYPENTAQLLQLRKTGSDADLNWQYDQNLGELSYGGTRELLNDAGLAPLLKPNVWHHMRVEISRDTYSGYRVFIDGQQAVEEVIDQFFFWENPIDAVLRFGNFTGWIDEVIVRSADVIFPPAITLAGDDRIVLRVGDTWNDPGASAVDYLGNTLSVTTSGTVDTLVPGEYTVSYEATDSDGETSIVTRTVVVELPPAPGERIAAFRFDCHGADSMARQSAIMPSGGALFNGTGLELPTTSAAATTSIDIADLYDPVNSFGFAFGFRVRVDSFASGANDLITLAIPGGAEIALAKATADSSAHLRDAAGEVVSAGTLGQSTGNWQHFRVTLNIDGYSVLRNGIEIASVANTSALASWTGASATLTVANFAGEVDDLVVTNIHPHLEGTDLTSLPTQVFTGVSDTASATIPEADIFVTGATDGIAISGTITPTAFSGFGVDFSRILGIEQNYNTYFSLERDTWALGPSVYSPAGEMLTLSEVATVLPLNQATKFVIRLDHEGYQIWANNRLVKAVSDSGALPLWEFNGDAAFAIGGFEGTIADAKVVRLQLPVEGHYEGWAAVNIADPTQRGAADDADGDGACNLHEFLHGSDPSTVGSFPLYQVVKIGPDFHLQFELSSGAGGCLDYVIEESPDLETWSISPLTPVTVSTTSGVSIMRAVLPYETNVFYRFTVTGG